VIVIRDAVEQVHTHHLFTAAFTRMTAFCFEMTEAQTELV